MSEEKECKCCHEWWYGSDVKEDLCPNCYDYFKQLKQQLDEKDKEIEKLKHLGSHETNMELFKENTKLIIEKRQFAIQELEKVKEDCFNQKELVDFGNVACFMVDIADILEIINNQIKELKGEKDVED